MKCATKHKYKGLAKSAASWQALIMVEKKKLYIGSYGSEEEAARVYDSFSIMINGCDAQTNFAYTKSQVLQLIDSTNSF